MAKRGPSRKIVWITLWIAIAVLGLWLTWLYLKDLSFPLIQTKGIVAHQQIALFYIAMALMLIIVIPVFAMAIIFPLRYREKHAKKRYQPHWQDNRLLEFVYWGVPVIIITILGTITWYSSHSLDPFRPLDSDKTPVKIQVVALEWKWLFIYPEARVASVNEIAFPAKRPVEFEITSDAPMNSFQIPALGGQIYAMSGMRTKLHLMADKPGAHRGFTNNLSGEGYADMNFMAYSKTEKDYAAWITQAKSSRKVLDMTHYKKLASPQKGKAPVMYYGSTDPSLYDTIVDKYMGHSMEEAH
jgi:cytochrome o ubiquinol oxidase subunit 2